MVALILRCCTVGLLLLTSALPALADEDHVAARRAREAGEVVPLSRILDAVEREFTGTIVEVELEREHGRWEYEVELLATGGRVVELTYDAATGQLLEAEGDDVGAARKR